VGNPRKYLGIFEVFNLIFFILNLKEERENLVDKLRSISLYNMIKKIISTFYTFISNEERENLVDKFTLIFLCNMIYKIIFKVIANQLMPIMSLIASQEQARYIEGC
jgi:hypothetical protein